jgi:DNA polymerase-3 subunit epsilon
VPLPAYYYHEHFLEMLEFVICHYEHALLECHVRLVADFRSMPRPAQCLYVRLVNRKGQVFAANKLRYPELGNVRSLLEVLQERGWVGPPGDKHYPAVLRYLTKAEIHRVLRPAFTGMSRSLKKDELVAFALEHSSATAFMNRLTANRILVREYVDEIRYLLFLYFGRIQEGLSQFTMRDLGLVRTHSFKEEFEPRFEDRDEALENYYFASRLHELGAAGHGDIVRLAAEMGGWPEPGFPTSALVRDELAYRLGRSMAKAGRLQEAQRLYAAGESAKCSESEIRLMLACGRRSGAEARLLQCLDTPRSEEEALMAQDLYAQKFGKKRTSAVTDELRAAETIDIDEASSGAPERAAIGHFERQGWRGYRTENQLWRTFFGLLFWHELFVDEKTTLHSAFESLPASLVDGSFYARNRDAIERRLAILDDPEKLRKELLKASIRHYGSLNGVFRWRKSMLDALFALIDHADEKSMSRVLRRFCEDYRHARYGYPDLMIIDDKGIRFVEIKAEGDQLRRNQLLRQRQLRDAGFRADVVRIRWIIDPQQDYVVVDVETTGGLGEQHRVTEIAALKVRNGQVIDRFQTLLNPQRAIPSGITRLTGISATMVAGAPLFPDVADEFEKFLQGAIFVAHNVDFDYRFIRQEFGRIGKPFRLPKLCTCSSMRRLYPGHKSYSLAALCERYSIPLTQHHRAMCDAEAAAELLLLINEKRAADIA